MKKPTPLAETTPDHLGLYDDLHALLNTIAGFLGLLSTSDFLSSREYLVRSAVSHHAVLAREAVDRLDAWWAERPLGQTDTHGTPAPAARSQAAPSSR